MIAAWRLLLVAMAIGFVIAAVLVAAADSNRDRATRCLGEFSLSKARDVCAEALREADSTEDVATKLRVLEHLVDIYEPPGASEEGLGAPDSGREPSSPTNYRNALRELAKAYEHARQPERSIAAWKMLADQYDESSRADLWMRGGAKLELGQVVEARGDSEQAERYYVESVEEMSNGPEPDSAYPAVARLINFYLSRNEIGKASQVCMQWKQVLDASGLVPSDYCESMQRESAE